MSSKAESGTPNFEVQLRAGGTVLASETQSTLAIVPGSFTTANVTYSALAGDPLLGQPLEIFLQSGGVQTNFDNVRLQVVPERAAVVEDALAGVESGRAGGFGLVIGVDRLNQAQALRDHGADLVVTAIWDGRQAAEGILDYLEV